MSWSCLSQRNLACPHPRARPPRQGEAVSRRDREADEGPREGEGGGAAIPKAKAIEAERDVALRKDPYFDWSQALLQIGIVLASVHLIIGNMMLLSEAAWRRSACS